MTCSVSRFDVCFGTVYLMCLQIILGSVKVAKWPPFRKKLLPRLTKFSLRIMSICFLSRFLWWAQGQDILF